MPAFAAIRLIRDDFGMERGTERAGAGFNVIYSLTQGKK